MLSVSYTHLDVYKRQEQICLIWVYEQIKVTREATTVGGTRLGTKTSVGEDVPIPIRNCRHLPHNNTH